MLGPVVPLDQFTTQLAHTLSAISSTDAPGQRTVELDAVIVVPVGTDASVTVMGTEAGLSPQVLLNTTVYTPTLEIVMLGVLSPVDQLRVQPAQGLSSDSSIDASSQSTVVPEADTMGVSGRVPTLTKMVLEASLSPQPLLRIAL